MPRYSREELTRRSYATAARARRTHFDRHAVDNRGVAVDDGCVGVVPEVNGGAGVVDGGGGRLVNKSNLRSKSKFAIFG